MRYTSLILLCCLFICSCHNGAPSQKNTVRINLPSDPSSLDSRVVRTLSPITIVRMFFEGLYRSGPDGKLVPAIAERYTVSEDLLTYTFYLRKAKWSNGDPVTADDFVYAWKSQLDPDFAAPNAYQLYPIKGARAAKEKTGLIDAVGVQAADAQTLVVQLEKPLAYFLELVAFHPFFPVPSKWIEKHPDWMEANGEKIVVNGPFRMKRWKHDDLIETEKNPDYWDQEKVHLSGVNFYILDDPTALHMFNQGMLDWAGSPLATLPPDSLASLQADGKLQTVSSAATYWIRFNTQKKWLKDSRFRKALSYAINRGAIVKHITQGGQLPALGIVPPQMGLYPEGYFSDDNQKVARKIFQKAGVEELEPITLTYSHNERSHKIAQAIQQQWETTLPIKVNLNQLEEKVFFQTIRDEDYEMSLGSWFADISDPINFLEIFESKEHKTNSTGWENPNFKKLVKASSEQQNPLLRRQILRDAEMLLLEEMPVAPIFFFTLNYIKNPRLKGAWVSDLGYIDFKYAEIK